MCNKETLELTKLNESNYDVWKFGIELLLDAKNLTGLIDGTREEPADKTKVEWRTWKTSASQASVILLSSVEKTLHRNLINCKSPAAIWTKLRDLYGASSEDIKDHLLQEYYDFRIKDGQAIAPQVEKFESICSKLEDAGEKQTDQAMVSRLLHSLPPRFSPFRMAWECTPKAERKKDSLTARLIREDKRLCEVEEGEEPQALRAEAYSTQRSNSSNNKCTGQCKKSSSKRDIEELKKRTKCAICKEKGHWARECPEKEREELSAKSVHMAQAFFSGIKVNQRSDDDSWIADSGASMHMSYRKDYFTTLSPCSEYVNTADNQSLRAIGKGTVIIREKLNDNLIERELRNVLYVPDLHRNLFSIPEINAKGYSFHAYKEYCEVRNNDGKLSSIGRVQGGLFKMNFKVKDEKNKKTHFNRERNSDLIITQHGEKEARNESSYQTSINFSVVKDCADHTDHNEEEHRQAVDNAPMKSPPRIQKDQHASEGKKKQGNDAAALEPQEKKRGKDTAASKPQTQTPLLHNQRKSEPIDRCRAPASRMKKSVDSKAIEDKKTSMKKFPIQRVLRTKPPNQ